MDWCYALESRFPVRVEFSSAAVWGEVKWGKAVQRMGSARDAISATEKQAVWTTASWADRLISAPFATCYPGEDDYAKQARMQNFAIPLGWISCLAAFFLPRSQP